MFPLQLRNNLLKNICMYIVNGIFQFLTHLNFVRGLVSKTSPV